MVEQSTKTEAETSSSNDLECLVDILTNPEKKILPLLYSTANVDDDENNNNNNNNNADQEKQTTLEALLSISKSLFLDIESMGKQYQALHEKQKAAERGTEEAPTTTTSTMILSGLNELYIPPEVEATDTDLPETIFGQVDLQTAALAKLVKKSTKRLKASSTSDDAENDAICILDMGVMESGDEDNDDGSDSDENDGDSDSQNSAEEEETEEFSDEEAERIRRRMERAMDDMEDDDEEGSSEEEEETANDTKKPETKEEEELYDPVAEDMKDGFFDLNEMEDFADEEEEFLPNEAFGQPGDEGKKKMNAASKKSFHQRQREGINNDSDDEDIDEDIDMYEEVREVKRKKYREQEDIDALYELYQETNPEDDDDDDGDIVNMTAADFFGGPKKRYIERYKKHHPAGKTAPKKDDDEDSWGEYDFDKEDQEGWRDDNDDDDEEGEGDEDEEIEDMKDPAMGEAEKEELEVPGRKTDDKKKLSKQEEKLRRETDELEKELINEKPWQMRGESKAMARPVNSLLEGTPEFEMASKQAPTITVEHTMNLEDVIKKRILAEDWDDVVPRELPDIGWNKKRGEAPEVSQEKSKLGLGELYEREYLKKAVGYDKDADEKQTEEDKAKDEMRQLFANLCSKLDALSNYHFAPRPIADEAEARAVTVPAIAMEEVLPLHVSDARGTAPEEVFATKRGREGILRADHEMDQQERKRQRQSKKAARRKARKEKEADEKLISRLQPGLGLNNPYEKRKAREELSEARAKGKVVQGEQDMDSKYGSSGTFFKRLQAEAQQTIQGQAAGDLADKQEKKAKARSSAYKL